MTEEAARCSLENQKQALDRIKVYREAFKRYGRDKQALVACEELGELVQAISKIIRKGFSAQTRRNLMEEIADVRVICEQQMDIWEIPESEVNDEMNRKTARLARRMREELSR